MRILFAVHGYPPDETAGTELYVEGAATELASLGHDVYVFAANPAAREPTHRVEEHDGVTVERCLGDVRAAPDGLLPLSDPGAEASFEAALERFRPNVVHIVSVLFLSPRIVELARRAAPTIVAPTDFSFVCPRIHVTVGTRHLLTGRLWGLNCFAHTEGRSARWLLSLARRRRLVDRVRWHLRRVRTFRDALTHADLILTPSEFVRRLYVRFGVSADRVEALPLGLELQPPLDGEPRPPGVRVGFLGAFVPDKGADLLVRAFSRTDVAATLVLRGQSLDTSYRAALSEAAAGDPRIELGDAVEPGGVPSFLATLDLLVIPTRVHESFSRVAREAFTAGVPVLAAAAGALPEIVTPGRNGALFPAGDERALQERLEELLRPGALESLRRFPPIKTMREHAHELVARYKRLAA